MKKKSNVSQEYRRPFSASTDEIMILGLLIIFFAAITLETIGSGAFGFNGLPGLISQIT